MTSYSVPSSPPATQRDHVHDNVPLPDNLDGIIIDGDVYVRWAQPYESFVQWWEQKSFAVRVASTRKSFLNPRHLWDNPRRKLAEWQEFEQLALESDGSAFIRCIHCETMLLHPVTGATGANNTGTGTIKTHLKSKFCMSKSKMGRGDSNASNYPPVDRTKFSELLIDAAVGMNIPFHAIEHESLFRLLSFLNPNVPSFSRKQLKAGIARRSKAMQTKIASSIPRNHMVSISTDGWTTAFMNHSLCGVFVNYIDSDWQFHSRLIDAIDASESKTAEARTKKIAEVVNEHGLQDKFKYVVADNGSDFNATALETNVRTLFGSRTSPTYKHIPCIAHVLQLVVKDIVQSISTNRDLSDLQVRNERFAIESMAALAEDALSDDMPDNDEAWFDAVIMEERIKRAKRTTGIMQALVKLQAIHAALARSPSRKQQFAAIQRETGDETSNNGVLNLSFPGRTRWNTITTMIHRSMRLRTSIDKFVADYLRETGRGRVKIDVILDWEWTQLEILHSILAPLAYLTNQAGSITDGFASHIPNIVVYVLKHLEKCNSKLHAMISTAAAKGGRPWGESIMAFKLGVQAGKAKMQKYRIKYAGMFTDLFGPLAILAPETADDNPFGGWAEYFVHPNNDSDANVEREAIRAVTDMVCARMTDSRVDEILGRQVEHVGSSISSFVHSLDSSPTKQVRATISQREKMVMVREKVTDLVTCQVRKKMQPGTNILGYWKEFDGLLELRQLARDLLVVTATSTALERNWSAGRRICRFDRGRLQPQTIRDILVLISFLHVQPGKPITASLASSSSITKDDEANRQREHKKLVDIMQVRGLYDIQSRLDILPAMRHGDFTHRSTHPARRVTPDNGYSQFRYDTQEQLDNTTEENGLDLEDESEPQDFQQLPPLPQPSSESDLSDLRTEDIKGTAGRDSDHESTPRPGPGQSAQSSDGLFVTDESPTRGRGQQAPAIGSDQSMRTESPAKRRRDSDTGLRKPKRILSNMNLRNRFTQS